MNLESLAKNIKKGDNGIYFSISDSEISYPEHGNENCFQIEENSFWFLHRNNVITKTVTHFSSNKMFFDIGGGNGFVAKRLQDEGLDVSLIEPGKSGALNAKARGIKNIVCSTLEDAAFTENSLDSAGLFDVVEHIKDDYSFLKNINSYLKEGGHIYITVPAYKFLWSNEDNEAGHYKRYTVKDLKNLLKSAGYKVKYATYIFSFLPLPVFVFRSLPSRLGLNKNSNNFDKHQKEHSNKKGLLNKILQKMLKWELNRIKKRKTIPFGGSCFVVATKI